MVTSGDHVSAFERALSEVEGGDTSLLMFICERTKLLDVLVDGRGLPQSLLLRLIQQMSVDLLEQTSLKVPYLILNFNSIFLFCSLIDLKDSTKRDFLTCKMILKNISVSSCTPLISILLSVGPQYSAQLERPDLILNRFFTQPKYIFVAGRNLLNHPSFLFHYLERSC